jgi:solute carrier family 25 (mitochondrial dicarboxylate transporter), member 10
MVFALIDNSKSRIGGAVGNPADVVNVRMQNDMSLPPEQRRNYKHALDGLVRLIREEGPSALTRGLIANTSRGVLMTAGQLASYDEFKKLLLKTRLMADNLGTHFTASFMAGFVATTVYFALRDLVDKQLLAD